ncbi:TonB-dependent receptor [Chitinophagaceae bacterium LB-8]|uniref:TonB-dependent receptor n=1 Tax=Paraflavisolibacter caeni TaxID=2982496 RepID=A0A9X2XVH2_9BACT|nr:TonB-dependent receptor [Paraflavisolibacter caeni]MCU7550084.1 TonB-dependent receptor [Paraflavisolibacter caeni]
MKITATKIPPKVMDDIALLLENAKAIGLLFLMTVLWVLPSMAQTVTVKGRIADEKNQPVVGASVSVKGTTIGATTDNNGEFQITAPANGSLVVSSVGFTAKEIPVNNQANQNITLTAATQSLENVVVVGYGTQKKKDVTGAVASVNMDALRDVPNTSLGQYLQGTVPGLNVGVSTVAGGTPPIAIRGQVSLSGNQNVLIILDGIQYSGSLSSINPDDIASIDVLKDPSSTAVYGAQAANGVILITSRRGRVNQKPRISFSTSYGTQKPTVGDLKPKNREEYLAGLTEAFYERSYLAPDFTQPNPNFNVATVVDASMKDANGNILPNDYDWWGEGTKTGTIWDNTLSISGGGDKVSYLLSGGLLDQKGYIINDIFKRKSIRANLETRPLNWLKVGLLSSAAFVNQDGAEPALASLQHISPLLVPYDSAGNLIPFPTNTLEPNPFTTYYVDNYDRNNSFFATIYTDIDIPFVKGLNYRMNFGNNYRVGEQFGSSIYAAGQTGEAYKGTQHYYDYTFDNILTYTKSFDKHNITATLLYGAVERKFDSTLARATGFSRLTLSYNNLSLGTNQFSTSDAWEEALNYQMARVNYKYNEKYLLTATIRRDGFSGFAEDHKYAVFPSAAIGWIISQESFMSNVNVVNNLKLRVGYGESGNQTTRYSSLSTVLAGTSNAYIFGDGGTPSFGQVVNTLGNPDLKWERTKGLNAGVDFALFKNQTTGSLDFYNNNTKDLLFGVFVPRISGFDTITTNLGHIRNTGFEASITQQIFNKKDFTWSATLNFSTNKNKIITLTGVDANGDGKEDDLIADSLFIGKSIHTIYDYQADGIYKINDTKLPGFQNGTVRIVDQNKDGVITPESDRVFLGRMEPSYRISLLNSLFYKGFSLSFLLNSVQGKSDSYLGSNRPWANNRPQYFREDNSIRWNDLKGIDYWSPANPNGKYPRNISGSRPIEPNQFEKRNFVRLQDVSLSYNFANLVKDVKFQSLTLYVSGKNLATWTNWEGWDPETGEGVVIGGRPVLRAFTVGLNIIY